MSLGKLVEVEDLKRLQPRVASDFTPWLPQDENVALLARWIRFRRNSPKKLNRFV